jgi:YhfZ C-terminal domain/Helix-turn-helix domain
VLDSPKNVQVMQGLANDLARRRVGDRLPTSRDYQARFGAGSGTISKCLRALEDVGVVSCVARGHQGTFVTGRRIGRLWAIAERGAVSALFTPPPRSQSERLIADLRAQFAAVEVPLNVVLRRGADRRVDDVLAGDADLAVISASAFARVTEENVRAWSLGPFSYYSRDSLTVLLRPGLAPVDDVRRVAVASDSLDHVRFSQAEFGDAVEYVAVEYDGLPLAVAERRVDAALWHHEPLLIPFEMVGIASRPLRRRVAIDLATTLSHAVIVARAEAAELAAVVDELERAAIGSALMSA